ncbi:prepilin-type N-terminal cleavage/methylation domain-containing protein [Luteimonas yindakuii]|uniref:Prepilin-type N-terminal cleavage/methylation domain-containing protein n=2 Tax=Luteimonas yindakuii TaxID=2565782 RepID=A0A4Z1QZY0_9GAMM|nr:prepilin-type N-terminal cleavage/methylation domain-containing protein [Luteimonas yindakuii]
MAWVSRCTPWVPMANRAARATMPTWVSCPRADRGRPVAGFSLLELLVVLFLISVMAAMVAPRLQRTYEAIASSGDRAEVLRSIEQLPFIARAQTQTLSLQPGNASGAELTQILGLPEGWLVAPVSALRVEINGFCHPAVLRVSGAGTVEDWALAAPDCRVDDAL